MLYFPPVVRNRLYGDEDSSSTTSNNKMMKKKQKAFYIQRGKDKRFQNDNRELFQMRAYNHVYDKLRLIDPYMYI